MIKKHIQYNSPVILSFFFISAISLILGYITNGWTTQHFFSVYASSPANPLFYVRLIGHVFGHSGVQHFVNNMVLLLVVGPPMEEKYGSGALMAGILTTAIVSGLLQCIFFAGTGILGASGIVFMLIMLSSLSGMKEGKIPLTLILVAILYLGQEVYSAIFVRDGVAHFMHVVGGACGTGFGFIMRKR